MATIIRGKTMLLWQPSATVCYTHPPWCIFRAYPMGINDNNFNNAVEVCERNFSLVHNYKEAYAPYQQHYNTLHVDAIPINHEHDLASSILLSMKADAHSPSESSSDSSPPPSPHYYPINDHDVDHRVPSTSGRSLRCKVKPCFVPGCLVCAKGCPENILKTPTW